MAALWVVAYHLLLPARFIGGVPALLAGRGYLAVDVFFVLSGFVMALTYGHLFEAGLRRRAFAGFLWRRVARLYPIYAAILVFRFAYTAWRYGGFELPRPWIAAPVPHPWIGIPANLLLVQSWGIAQSSIGPAWSISTEWAAYWAFPLLAGCMLHRGPRAALAGVFGAAVLLLGTAVLLHTEGDHGRMLDAWDGRTAGPMMRCLAGFTLGLGVFRLSTWPPAARLAARPEAGWTMLAVFVAMLAASVPDPVVYPLFPAMVLCLACGGNRGMPGLFARAPIVWLGEISYSLYLLHIFLLHPLDEARAAMRLVLPPAPADFVSASLVLLFLLAGADLTYRLIERPGRTFLASFRPG